MLQGQHSIGYTRDAPSIHKCVYLFKSFVSCSCSNLCPIWSMGRAHRHDGSSIHECFYLSKSFVRYTSNCINCPMLSVCVSFVVFIHSLTREYRGCLKYLVCNSTRIWPINARTCVMCAVLHRQCCVWDATWDGNHARLSQLLAACE